jgi:glyoxylase-like metal-dependent hydrolase (beta-lactamase superfamily II)
MGSRRGFLKKTLGVCFTGGSVVDQALFRAVEARAQSKSALPELFDIQKLADGIYAAVAKPQTLLNCNAVVVENSEDLLILDSHSKPSAVASLVRQLRDQVTKKPVRYVVASHFHWDHAQGLPAYRRLAPHAEIVSTEATRRLIGDQTAKRLKQSLEELEKSIDGLKRKVAEAKSGEERLAQEQVLRETRDYLSEMKAFTPELPNLTFDRDLILHDKAHDLHLAFRGRAHTDGDLVVYCPQKKVIATGDMAHGFFPFIADGYPLEYSRTLIAVAQFDFTKLAGGHGPVQEGKSRLYQTANYLEELTQAVLQGRRAGKPLERLQAEITPGTLRSLADGGYGEYAARNNLQYRVMPLPRPSVSDVLQSAIKEAVAQTYARLEAQS